MHHGRSLSVAQNREERQCASRGFHLVPVVACTRDTADLHLQVMRQALRSAQQNRNARYLNPVRVQRDFLLFVLLLLFHTGPQTYSWVCVDQWMRMKSCEGMLASLCHGLIDEQNLISMDWRPHLHMVDLLSSTWGEYLRCVSERNPGKTIRIALSVFQRIELYQHNSWAWLLCMCLS